MIILPTMTINWHRITTIIINYFTIHVFLHLISLPIIIAWGLPSSWLSPVGNFLFTPLLSLFLFFSSLVFFSELVGMPHTMFNWLLECIATCWHWLLHQAPSNSLYGFLSPSWWLLSCIAIIALVSMMHPIMRNPRYRLLGLTGWLMLSMTLLRAHKPSSSCIRTMPCHHGVITIIRDHNQTIVIDPGYIGSRISASSWISYTFMPELIATTGSLTIDHLILLKLNTLTCEAIDTLLHDAHIQHIYLPYMEGNMTGSFARAFNKLYAHIKAINIPITRFSYDPMTIAIDDDVTLAIQSEGSRSYQALSAPRLEVEGIVHGEKVSIKGK